jgi:hypothetical protein
MRSDSSRQNRVVAQLTYEQKERQIKQLQYLEKESQRVLTRGVSVPNTANANIDKSFLRQQLARSTSEMHLNVNEGTQPIFGYPLVCFTPIHKRKSIHQGADEED